MSKVQVDTIDTRSGTSTMQIGSTNTSTINIGVSGDTVNIPSGVTIANAGTATGFGDDNAPSFRAYLSSVQAISNSTRTILAFNNDSGTTGGIKAYDTDNAFDTSTYKFTPQTAGYYYAYLYCGLQDLNSGNFYQLNLCKNGSADDNKFSQFYIRQNGTDSIYGHTSGVAYLNGSSDYIVGVMQHNHGSNRNTSDTYNSGFGAYRLAGVS